MKGTFLMGLGAALLLVAGAAYAGEQTLPPLTLTDLDGGRHKSEELIGDGAVLLNFWATWCKPCLAEMPKLADFEAKWSEQGFRILSINIDDPRTQKQVKPFVHKQQIAFPVYVDPNQEVYRKLGGRAVPFSVLVGSGGEILKVSQGWQDKVAEEWGSLIKADLAAHPRQAKAKGKAEAGSE
jgi:thiol-disulfide isomerase/thioredoxin